jgi:hypothetical protein
LCSKENIAWGEVVGKLQEIPGLQEIEWEESDVP